MITVKVPEKRHDQKFGGPRLAIIADDEKRDANRLLYAGHDDVLLVSAEIDLDITILGKQKVSLLGKLGSITLNLDEGSIVDATRADCSVLQVQSSGAYTLNAGSNPVEELS